MLAAPVSAPTSARERIIVALDVPTEAEARDVVSELGEAVGAFKIGMQLFTAAGPDLVRDLADKGLRIFLDLKFYDIPNTVAMAGIGAAKLGVWMFNVHASGGRDMMLRTVEAVDAFCSGAGAVRPLIIGVTVLTSSGEATLAETGVTMGLEDQVAALSMLARDAGLDGVVASAREVSSIRKAVDSPSFITVTPGIRRTTETLHDQQRVMGITDAIANGSDYVVIGRPILHAKDKHRAVQMFIEEAERPQNALTND